MLVELPVQQPRYAPVRNLMLYLTEDCNLRCSYCFVEKRPKKMSLETALGALRWVVKPQISGFESSVEVTFFGGEPFLELDLLEELIRAARDLPKRITFAATTNGTIAGPRVERILKEGNVRLLVSLDGDERGNEARKTLAGKSSYPMVTRNLPQLLEWTPSLIVRTTFHPGNLDLLGQVRHILELGAKSIALAPVVEADWNGSEQKLDEAYTELGEWFLDECRSLRRPPLELTWDLIRLWHRHHCGGSPPAEACKLGTSLLSVQPDGNVMPCHRFLYRPQDWLGSIHDAELPEKRAQYLALHSWQKGVCASCPARPVCGGGCRLLALQAGLGLTGVFSNHCLLMRSHARMARHLYLTLLAEKNAVLSQLLSRPGWFSGSVLQELSQ